MVLRGKTRITRKGQITRPASVRRALGLREGDTIEVTYDESTRQVTLQDAQSVVLQTAGIFPPKHPVPGDIYELVDEEKRRIHEGMMAGAVERDRRSRDG